jgi:hypothetical protein
LNSQKVMIEKIFDNENLNYESLMKGKIDTKISMTDPSNDALFVAII